MKDFRERYLDLLQLTLTDTAYSHTASIPMRMQQGRVARYVGRALRSQGIELVRVLPTDAPTRLEGRDWPRFAQTMVGIMRLDQLQSCVEDVIANQVPGDVIETGVWRGGASIFMRAVLAVHGVTDRRVFVADSFGGLPPPDAERHPADAGSTLHRWGALAISLDEVRNNFDRYGLLDDQVVFLKGWFRDTLPTLTGHRWAVIRLDGDMYESTMDGLEHLYPGLSPGGYVIIDDYGAMEECRQAVHDYRQVHGIHEPIVHGDWTAVCWQRQA